MRRRLLAATLCALMMLGLGMAGTSAAESDLQWELVDIEDVSADIADWVESEKGERGLHLLASGDERYLLIAWGEKMTGGYTVEVSDAAWHLGQNVRVNVELVEPDPDEAVTQALTYPYQLLSLEPGEETVMVNFTGADWLEGDIAEVSEDDPLIVLEVLGDPDGVAPNPLILEGRARVFEATFEVVIEDGHYHLSEDVFTAATAGPEWAQFALAIPYDDPTSPSGMAIGAWESAETGDLVEEAIVPLTFGNASRPLPDVRRHWAEASIRRGVGRGFVDGYPDGTFRPDGMVTRAEFLKMLVASETGGEPAVDNDGTIPFTDVSGHWIEPYVRWAVSADWMPEGEFGDQFGPDRQILRQEMALMAALAVGLEAGEEDLDFTDSETVDAGLQGWIAAAVEAGLLVGYPDGSFGPERGLRRSEAVTVVWRAISLMD